VDTSRQLADCYKGAAHRLGVCFADAGAWDIGLAFDGVHFSEEGHLAFAKGIDQALRRIAAEADEEA
jgi:lysophospholipase L1-like esterase